jgi:hypothetical protein
MIGEFMNKRTLLGWAVALVSVAACTSTPTPAPATAALPTNLPATTAATQAAPTTAAATTAPATPGEGTTPDTNSTLAAASPTPPSPTEADITPAAGTPVAAGEVVKLAGNSFTTSDTYTFGADTTLDVTWNYTGTAPFALWLVNASDVVTDPNFDRILVNDVTGPHSGTSKTKIIAGDWQVQVEQAEGPWTVEFQPES